MTTLLLTNTLSSRRHCESDHCLGWSKWSPWSVCLHGLRVRTRECDGSDACDGHFKEVRECSLRDPFVDDNTLSNSLDDKPMYRTAPILHNSNDGSYSLQKLVITSLLSFSFGAIVSGIVVYVFIAKSERMRDLRHHRLSLRLFPVKSASNAYESPHEYKANQSALSPLNSVPPVREATIKRSSTIRAQLHSDQNF